MNFHAAVIILQLKNIREELHEEDSAATSTWQYYVEAGLVVANVPRASSLVKLDMSWGCAQPSRWCLSDLRELILSIRRRILAGPICSGRYSQAC